MCYFFSRVNWLLIAAFIILFSTSDLLSQNSITIGSGTQSGISANSAAGDPGPIYRSSSSNNFIYSRHHYLYTQAELAAAGFSSGMRITKLAWNKLNTGAFNNAAMMEVWIKNSSLTTVPAPPQTWSNLTTGSSLAFYDPVTLSSSIGFVDFAFDTPFIYYGGALEISVSYNHGAGTSPWSTDGISWAKDPEINKTISYCGASVSNTLNNLRTVRPQLKFTYFKPISPNNASVTNLVSDSVICPGSNLIKVRIRNSGTSRLNNVTIQWMLNGVSQAPVYWTSPLDTIGGTAYRNDTVITLGNVMLVGKYNLKAWTEMPNSVADTVNADDTLNISLNSKYSGTYTIDTGLAGPLNFKSFTEASNALNQFGVCGPVIINVSPGVYKDHLDLYAVPGVSSVNTITIDGLDAHNRVLNFDKVGSLFDGVVRINNTPYVTIKNLTLITPQPQSSFGVLLSGSSSNCKVSKCDIRLPSGSSYTSSSGIYVNYTVGNTLCDSNEISGGYWGIYLAGISSQIGLNNRIYANHISDFYKTGVSMNYQNGIEILNNIIIGGDHFKEDAGVWCSNVKNNGTRQVLIEGNTIWNVSMAFNIQGNNTAAVKGRIANNRVGKGMTSGGAAQCGLMGDYWTVAHNTIIADYADGMPFLSCLSIYSTVGISLMNNIVVTTGSGNAVPLLISNLAALDSMDYNNFYRTDTSCGSELIYVGTVNYTAQYINSFKGISGFNVHSVYADPELYNDSIPVSANACLKGIYLAHVSKDINGLARSLSGPAIGASEQLSLSNDLEVAAVLKPVFPLNAGSYDIVMCVKNNGTGIINSFSASYISNNSLPVTITWTGALAPCDTAHVRFTGAQQINVSSINRLTLYTSSPNGMIDLYSNNDTLKTAWRIPLSGSYTVGGPTADFNTIADMSEALETAGVSGAVTFNFTPNYPAFYGGIKLTHVNGASAINTITLNGNGDTLIGYNGKNGTYIIQLNGTSHVIIQNFNMRPLSILNPGCGILLRNNCRNIEIRNNTIEMGIISDLPTAGITASASLNIGHEGITANNILIEGNTIIGANTGISLTGTTDPQGSYNIRVVNNIIKDFSGYGIRATRSDSITISGNRIFRKERYAVSSYLYGIVITGCNRGTIYANRIYDESPFEGTFHCYGIALYQSGGSIGNQLLLSNNVIQSFSSRGHTYGIYTSSRRIKLYHNTIDIINNGPAGIEAIAVWLQYSSDSVFMANNILSVRGSGDATRMLINNGAVSTSFMSDRNVFYIGAVGPNNYIGYAGSHRTTLANWQTATGRDINSLNTNPEFAVIKKDYTPLAPAIDNLGTNAGVLTDINQINRSTTTPDPGAHEFTSVSKDLALTGLQVNRAGVCYNQMDTLRISIRNTLGPDLSLATDSITVFWEVTGPVNSSGSVVLNSGILSASTTNIVNVRSNIFPQPGTYSVKAYIMYTTFNLSVLNDTVIIEQKITPLLTVTPKSITINDHTAKVLLTANSPAFPRTKAFFSEICQLKSSTGRPAGGWPSYMAAIGGYVELTGIPGSDLGGYRLEQWWSPSLYHCDTLPYGTIFSPNGTMIITTGNSNLSTNSPSNYYYVGGNNTSKNSTDNCGYVLKTPDGEIVDAVAYGTYSFPMVSGVTSNDWTGSNTIQSSGIRLVGPDNNTSSNWITATSIQTQTPNTLNTNVPALTPPPGFSWNYNNTILSNLPQVVVGPFITPGTYTYVAAYTNGCGTFYDTVIITASNSVPVKLLSFTGRVASKNAILNWQTASEKNTSHFEIYSSEDGINYKSIGLVNASGNSNIVQHYNFFDAGAFDNINQRYYKLKITDKDGRFEWSNVIELNTAGIVSTFVVAPNPFHDELWLTLGDHTPAEIKVTAITGETVYTIRPEVGAYKISLMQLTTLKPGIYFMLVTQQGVTTVSKLIKN